MIIYVLFHEYLIIKAEASDERVWGKFRKPYLHNFISDSSRFLFPISPVVYYE